MGCVSPIVVISIVSHAEFGRHDHREYAPHFIFVCSELNFEYLKAQENFEDEANRKFNLKQFRKMSIRKVFDSLHGISDESIPLSNTVEIMAYCLIDGKVDQDSEFETDLYEELVEQLRDMKAGFMIK